MHLPPLRVLFFTRESEERGRWWIAQCIDYNIAAQAKTFPDIQYEIERLIVGRIAVADRLGWENPFEGLGPAPDYYREMFETTSGPIQLSESTPFELQEIPERLRIPELDRRVA